MDEPRRENYQDEAEAPFDPNYSEGRISEWGSPVECALGPAGLCWENARKVARTAPEHYLYAEGLAFNHGEWSGHGWVIRKSDGQVVECTDGYDTSTRYRGICWEVVEVEQFIDNRPLVDGRTCRERWRTRNGDGSGRSEAPGVMWILAEELVVQRRDPFEFIEEQTSWLNRGTTGP